MMQGTTPVNIFTIPFEKSEIKNLSVVYAQSNKVIIKKKMRDCELNDNEIIVRLSQEDTFAFDDRLRVKIQVRVLTNDGESYVSDPIYVDVSECLDDEVLK